MQKNQKYSIFGTLVLVVGLITSVVLVQRSQSLEGQAFTDPVVFTMSPSTVKTTTGSAFVIDVLANPQGNPVSGLEFRMEYNPQYLSVRPEDVTLGTFLPVQLGQTTIQQSSSSKNILTFALAASCTSTGCAPALQSSKLASIKFSARTLVGSTQVGVSSLTKVASATDTSPTSTGIAFTSTPVTVSVLDLIPPPSPSPSHVPVPTFTPAPTISPTEPPISGNIRLKPIADIHVKEVNPSNNYANSDHLVASNYEESSRQMAYLKFDLRSVSGSVKKAQLKLTPRLARNVTKTVHTVPSNSWTEESMTWSNKPSADVRMGYFEGIVEVDRSIYITLNTSTINSFAGKILSMRVGNDSDDNNTLNFYSREVSAMSPELILDVEGSTAPSAAYVLPVKDDSYVQSYSDRVDNNYGSQTSLITSSYYDNNTRLAYIKFNGSQIAGKTITSAKLVLTPQLSRKVEKEVRSVSNNSWTEENITYNNRPATGSVVGRIISMDNDLAIDRPITIDLSASGITMSSNGDISVAIVNLASDNTLVVYSKEASTSSYRPRLIVEAH